MSDAEKNAPAPETAQRHFQRGAADSPGSAARDSSSEKDDGSIRPTVAPAPPPSGSNGKAATMQEARHESGSGALFSALSHIGPVLLLFFLACQAWPDFWQAFLGKAYYCPAEANTIAIISQTLSGGEWLRPEASSASSITWPGYIWFSCLLAQGCMPFFQSQDMLFPLASTLAAALALLAAWGLAIGCGYGKRAAMAAGLILLCSPIFVPLAHFSGGAALAAAFLMLSLILFFMGWRAERSFICLPLAFICAGLAGLTGGLFHLLLPLITSLIFLIWCGRFRRAQKADAILGFMLLVALICGWLSAIILTTAESPYLSYLAKNLVRPVWEEPEIFYWPLLAAGIGILPWLIMVFCVSWHKFFANALPALLSSRKENAGVSLLWIALACGILLSFFSPARQIQPVAVALACLAGILLGRSFLKLSDIGVRIFYLATGLILFVGGLGLLACHCSFTQDLLLEMLPFETAAGYRAILLDMPALPVIGGICIVAALLLIRFMVSNRHGNGLIYCALVSIALCQPVCLMLVPELAASKDAPLCLLSDINNWAGSWQENTKAKEDAAAWPNQDRAAGPDDNETANESAPIAPEQGDIRSGTIDDALNRNLPDTMESAAEQLPDGSENAVQGDSKPGVPAQ